jgi:hypothetical protein
MILYATCLIWTKDEALVCCVLEVANNLLNGLLMVGQAWIDTELSTLMNGHHQFWQSQACEIDELAYCRPVMKGSPPL